jgi:hypothetical protein
MSHQQPAQDETQAKFFAVDAELRSRAAYNKYTKFFNSQSHLSKVSAVVQTVKDMLRVDNTAFYEKVFETAREQKKNGIHTDVTVFKFMPNRYIKSADVIKAITKLGFDANYNVRSGNIKIVVK